jgi:hypothetical protein
MDYSELWIIGSIMLNLASGTERKRVNGLLKELISAGNGVSHRMTKAVFSIITILKIFREMCG